MAKDKPRFQYRGRTSEDVNRRAKQQSGTYDSYLVQEVMTFKAKEGENTIRILPGTWDDAEKWGTHWGIDIYVHYNVGPDNATYLCLDKMKGEPCPVCEARREAADQEEADSLRPVNRVLCWLIDRNDEKSGPKAWAMPLNTSKDISARSLDKKTNEAILIDGAGTNKDGEVIEGYDLFFDREGEKKRTKYVKIDVSRDSSLLHEDERLEEKWLNYITDNPLPDMLNFYEADYIQKILFGSSERAERTEADVEERPSRRTSRRGDADAEDTDRPSRSARERPERTSGRRGLIQEDDEAPAEREERPSGRRGRVQEEEPPFDADEKETHRPRASGRRRAEPEPEPEPEEAEAEPERGGRRPVSRFRGNGAGEAEAEAEAEAPRGRGRARAEPEPEASTPRQRLSNLGRRRA
jgi:hypothetical protein